MTALFDEFEENVTPEARFAHAMDNLQPIILNNSNGGEDWKENGICSAQVYKRQEKARAGSETLYQYIASLIEENVKKGSLKKSD